MNNSDMPAMPFVEGDGPCSVATGLTKREHFAGLAMQGILISDPQQSSSSRYIARQALEVADALLAALEQEQSA